MRVIVIPDRSEGYKDLTVIDACIRDRGGSSISFFAALKNDS